MTSTLRHLAVALGPATFALVVGAAEQSDVEAPNEGARPGALSEEGQQLLEEGWQVAELPELEDVQRQRAQKLNRSVEKGRDLQRREVNRVQDRIGPTTWGLWEDW